jgi:NADPH:quinone reductase-like Zn-dependent oxidoreductase
MLLDDNGETVLTGPVVDQAALHGLLRKVRDLGLPLVSVQRVKPSQAEVPAAKMRIGRDHLLRGIRMKAFVYPRYGSPDVLALADLEKPVIDDDQLLVRVHACSVNPADWHSMTGLPIARPSTGLLKPKDTRLGIDYAGVVEAVGANVTGFRPGDEVFGGRSGAFAEYVSVRADRAVVHKPANVTFEQAAAVPVAALSALQGLRDHGHLQAGQRVVINGASGGVGTYAVQLAKWFGAEVTGVCSTRNVDMVRSLGADHVVDYTRDDFTHTQQRYDLLLDNAGGRSWSDYRRVLTPKATLVIVGGPKTNRWIGPLSHVLRVRLASLRAGQKVTFFMAKLTKDDLLIMQDLLATGKVTSVIDRCYPFAELPEAMRYLGTGHARAKVVVTLQPPVEGAGQTASG